MRAWSNINNKKAHEWGLNLAQTVVFSLLYELPSWADEEVIGGKAYYFLTPNKAIDEIPYVTDKPDTMKRHFMSLEKMGLIEYKKIDGKDYYRLTEKSKEWNEIYSEKNPNDGKKSEESRKKIRKVSEKNPTYINNPEDLNNPVILPREKSHSKNKTSFPSDDSELKAYAIIKATDDGIKCPITTYESFKDHHIANGSKFNDWKRAFNLWTRNFYQFKTENFKEKVDVQLDGYPPLIGTYSYDEEIFYDEYNQPKMKILKSFFVNQLIAGSIKPTGRAA